MNLVAAYISAGRSEEVAALMSSLQLSAPDSFEVAYNAACAALAQGRLREAHQLLVLAQRTGRETLLEEEYAEEEVEQELLPSALRAAHALPARVRALTRAQSRCSWRTWRRCRGAARRRWRRTRRC